MAYNIINTQEVNKSNDGLTLLKYAILENNNNYYLQLKIRNDSNSKIDSFVIRYRTSYNTYEFKVHTESKPGEIFFKKNLIPIDSTEFDFIEFNNVEKSAVVQVNNSYSNNSFNNSNISSSSYGFDDSFGSNSSSGFDNSTKSNGFDDSNGFGFDPFSSKRNSSNSNETIKLVTPLFLFGLSAFALLITILLVTL